MWNVLKVGPALVLMSVLGVVSAATQAGEPASTTPVTPAQNPEQFDRDGKHIVGYELMTDSERQGYRAQLFFMKTLPERDKFRAEHRKAMEKRATERGVTLNE